MIRINLIGQPPKKSALWPAQQPPVALYAIILLLTSLLAMGLWYWSLHSQCNDMLALKEELEQEVRQLEVVRAELEKHEELKQNLSERISVIERLKTSQKGPVLLMNGVISSIPQNPTLWLSSLTFRTSRPYYLGIFFPACRGGRKARSGTWRSARICFCKAVNSGGKTCTT